MNAIRDALGLVTLPTGVKPPVIERKTPSTGPPFFVLALESTSLDFGELTHYAHLNLKNIFRGIKGVASVEIMGRPYTYTISLDPKKMHSFGVNVDEVYAALQTINASLPVGKFQDKIPTTMEVDFNSVTDFESLLVKEKNFMDPAAKQDPIFLGQIADIKLKTDHSKFRIRSNGQPGLCVFINRSNDANPLEVSTLITEEVRKLKESLPSSLKINIILDQAEFVRYSIDNVTWSLFEAIICVLIIVFLFLRNIKSTIIPAITIPISLLGSFIFLKVLGFSINIITLLGMVLAIGLVVDDAIVVMENIQRYIETGLKPFQAALKGSREIGFAIVGMTITLTCVYAPLFFIVGPVGDVFIEFAVALAGSVLISGFVALTLSPLMCVYTLHQKHTPFWPQIDIFFDQVTNRYARALCWIIPKRKVTFTLLLGSLVAIIFLLRSLPSEIAPKEDRNLIGVYIPPVPGKNLDYMEEKANLVEEIIKNTPEAQNHFVFLGDWGGNVILTLKPKSQRKRSAQEIVNAYAPAMQKIPSVDAHPWSWDSGLPGMEQAGAASDLSLIISTSKTYPELFDSLEKVKSTLRKAQIFANVDHNLKLDSLGYKITLNPHAMADLNISPPQAAKTIEVFFSGDQTLTFAKDGVIYALTLEGISRPWNLEELYVSNRSGERISLAVVAQLTPTSRPDKLFHYNQMRSVVLTSDLPEGKSLDDGMKEFRSVVHELLPIDYKTTWGGSAKGYKDSQNSMIFLFALSIIFIYAILAILFESFLDPLLILIMAPFACLGGLGIQWMTNEPLTIYTQIGLVTLIGLISKHGILMVEFANQLSKDLPLSEAIQKASILRLRPILMTTGAMVFGTLPLLLGNGAGQEAQRAIGMVLVGGLSVGTLFTLFVLPPLYITFKNISFKAIVKA